MAEYFSYAQKAAHYFKRPHEAPARTPIETPAAWCGPELADRDAWRAVLSASQRHELERALSAVKSTGKPAGSMRVQDFPLPTLSAYMTYTPRTSAAGGMWRISTIRASLLGDRRRSS